VCGRALVRVSNQQKRWGENKKTKTKTKQKQKQNKKNVKNSRR
jgi:hypothetical protein